MKQSINVGFRPCMRLAPFDCYRSNAGARQCNRDECCLREREKYEKERGELEEQVQAQIRASHAERAEKLETMRRELEEGTEREEAKLREEAEKKLAAARSEIEEGYAAKLVEMEREQEEELRERGRKSRELLEAEMKSKRDDDIAAFEKERAVLEARQRSTPPSPLTTHHSSLTTHHSSLIPQPPPSNPQPPSLHPRRSFRSQVLDTHQTASQSAPPLGPNPQTGQQGGACCPRDGAGRQRRQAQAC